jgi:carbon storage regulator
MLCLSRRPGEQIVIDGPCVITLVELRRGAARIGIEAPRDVNILRAELVESSTQEEFRNEDRGVSVE